MHIALNRTKPSHTHVLDSFGDSVNNVSAVAVAVTVAVKNDIVQVTYTMFGPVVDMGGTGMVT